jgi:hypothetical protein
LDRPKNARQAALTDPVSNVVHQPKSQRQRIVALADEAGKLRTHGKGLLAESYSLAARMKLSCANLTDTLLDTKATKRSMRRPLGIVGEESVDETHLIDDEKAEGQA